jgi:hypothetical protein
MCPLMHYPDLLLIWQTELKSDIIEIINSFSCFLHNINSTSRIQDAAQKVSPGISVNVVDRTLRSQVR